MQLNIRRLNSHGASYRTSLLTEIGVARSILVHSHGKYDVWNICGILHVVNVEWRNQPLFTKQVTSLDMHEVKYTRACVANT